MTAHVSPIPSTCWSLGIAAVVAALLGANVAWAEDPLYEQEPFDQITLNAQNKNLVLKVQPLAFPNRRMPAQMPKTITIRLIDRPNEAYEVDWSAIARLELFEEMVLNEGKRLYQAGQLEDAYDYFKYLDARDPEYPGLQAAIEEYLYEEAKARHQKQQYTGMLAVLHELQQRNPQWPNLNRAMGVATEKLVENYLAAGNYAAARALLRQLASAFPQHPVVVKWENQLKGQAAVLFTKAKQAQSQGRLREALQTGLRLADIWPALPGAEGLLESIHNQYPRVVVGVAEATSSHKPGQFDDWAARRSSRLVYRTLMEFVGQGAEGGEYRSALGQISMQELGLRLIVELKPDLHWSTGPSVLTGGDLSRRFLAMADPTDPAYRPDWAELFGGVSVPRVYTVEVDLRKPHVRPQALLQIIAAPYSDPRVPDPTHLSNGPYSIDSQQETETVYIANEQYFAAEPGQPKEIVERHYPKGSEAIAALKRREIDVLDRINPWDLDKVLSNREIVVERYTMPLIHCLVPNLNRPLLANSNFRRALVYGIHRPAILRRLLNGKQRPGCRVVSGPFSAGIDANDPSGYAYDETIEPRDYDPRLAIALAQVGFQQTADTVKRQGGEMKEMPRLVLAHPANEIARLAAAMIERQLNALRIPVAIQELPAGVPSHVPDNVDLVYVELAMWEPVVDAGRLLDQTGLTGSTSPYLSLALQQLAQASTWPDVGNRLRQIHTLVHQEVAIVPLWQLTDHFAYHRSLKGIAPQPVSLYQNIEQWRPAFHYRTDGR